MQEIGLYDFVTTSTLCYRKIFYPKGCDLPMHSGIINNFKTAHNYITRQTSWLALKYIQ